MLLVGTRPSFHQLPGMEANTFILQPGEWKAPSLTSEKHLSLQKLLFTGNAPSPSALDGKNLGLRQGLTSWVTATQSLHFRKEISYHERTEGKQQSWWAEQRQVCQDGGFHYGTFTWPYLSHIHINSRLILTGPVTFLPLVPLWASYKL